MHTASLWAKNPVQGIYPGLPWAFSGERVAPPWVLRSLGSLGSLRALRALMGSLGTLNL